LKSLDVKETLRGPFLLLFKKQSATRILNSAYPWYDPTTDFCRQGDLNFQ
jgi:hypothetical protein